jgi:Zn-dependent protease with chaperone function
MTAGLGLVAFAALLAGPGTRALSRASWTLRAPGLAIVAWQATTLAMFASLVMAGLSVALPEVPDSEGVTSFLHACSLALQSHYASPGGIAVGLSGVLLATVLLARLGYALIRGGMRTFQALQRQRDVISLVARRHERPDVVVIDHSTPVVYCLPGRHQRIVVSRGALTALSSAQLDQVLAHERAHLRARHHLALLVADTLAWSLWGRLGTRQARDRIADLAEMHADDAVESTRRKELATAMFVLAGGAQPLGTLGATGGAVALRVRRLLAPSAPMSGRERAGLMTMVAVTVLLPVVIVVTPAVAAALFDACPLFV